MFYQYVSAFFSNENIIEGKTINKFSYLVIVIATNAILNMTLLRDTAGIASKLYLPSRHAVSNPDHAKLL
jgi:hypothetical protein